MLVFCHSAIVYLIFILHMAANSSCSDHSYSSVHKRIVLLEDDDDWLADELSDDGGLSYLHLVSILNS